MLGRPNKISVGKFIDLKTTSIQEILIDFHRKRNKKARQNYLSGFFLE